jgi:hypothetical protein
VAAAAKLLNVLRVIVERVAILVMKFNSRLFATAFTHTQGKATSNASPTCVWCDVGLEFTAHVISISNKQIVLLFVQ